jgi:hypothetical protein
MITKESCHAAAKISAKPSFFFLIKKKKKDFYVFAFYMFDEISMRKRKFFGLYFEIFE